MINTEALARGIRNDALEEAAKIAEEQEGYPTLTIGECGCGEEIAEKIRKLKESA
jgi:hypothetical protein